MPTLLRFRNLRVVVYTEDHPPAHVHVLGPDREAIFFLRCWKGPVALRKQEGFNRSEETAVADFLDTQLELLCVRPGRICMVTQQEHDEATLRGLEELRTQPRALAVRYEKISNLILVDLNTGYTIAFPPERHQGLSTATPEDLSEIEISFPGFGIYFPKADADLWVPALAQGIFGSKHWEAAWLAAHPLEESPFRVKEAPVENAQTEAA